MDCIFKFMNKKQRLKDESQVWTRHIACLKGLGHTAGKLWEGLSRVYQDASKAGTGIVMCDSYRLSSPVEGGYLGLPRPLDLREQITGGLEDRWG